MERFETSKGVRDTQHFADLLRAGQRLLFFPEGTFTRAPGLRPFYLGAFTVAAQAAVPVIPVAIRGTRSILRSGSWFPHRGTISIEVGAPVDPRELEAQAGTDHWRIAIALRDRCRAFILRHCGEPDLAGAGLTDHHEGTRGNTKEDQGEQAIEARPKGNRHGASRSAD